MQGRPSSALLRSPQVELKDFGWLPYDENYTSVYKNISLIQRSNSIILSTISGTSNIILSFLIPVVNRPYICQFHKVASKVH